MTDDAPAPADRGTNTDAKDPRERLVRRRGTRARPEVPPPPAGPDYFDVPDHSVRVEASAEGPRGA